jgi:hypothetical protein
MHCFWNCRCVFAVKINLQKNLSRQRTTKGVGSALTRSFFFSEQVSHWRRWNLHNDHGGHAPQLLVRGEHWKLGWSWSFVSVLRQNEAKRIFEFSGEIDPDPLNTAPSSTDGVGYGQFSSMKLSRYHIGTYLVEQIRSLSINININSGIGAIKNHIFTTVWSGNGEILPGSGHSYLRKDVSGKTNWSFEDLSQLNSKLRHIRN